MEKQTQPKNVRALDLAPVPSSSPDATNGEEVNEEAFETYVPKIDGVEVEPETEGLDQGENEEPPEIMVPQTQRSTRDRVPSIPEVVENQLLKLEKIHTDKNPADMRTKVIPRKKLKLCKELARMDSKVQIPSRNSALIAMIADEDTITGFLLAGVGNVDLRRKTNYLIVDSKTTVKQIEDTFKEFTAREDIAIVLISQYVANMIRFLVDSYNKPVPAILEIPSKDHPYDPTHDSVLSRVKYLFSAESVASERR
ncbi:hypothetical protein RJ639_042280 [Escallonia herrerae]|uniref:V-type proton ATPase subunit F n=1 Tax=Escallonia herrerae TaxID=1293975 RepID=A0AA88WJY8_9ASTE|nr:hypothetical protein RJ639_042280 [Escallonia herrerae]